MPDLPATPGVRLPGRVRLRRDVITAAVGEGMTLVNTAGQMFHLNASGRLAVHALADGVPAAVAALRTRYGLSQDDAAHDLDHLLGQLDAADLIRLR
ncbi:PqqD family protein [Candidatus Protofrankia californiensis]|uniref:PqqD family protein n=1 Tax=Candidatus Protofrankia californiensis TaxID=1839754 RepID=UPI00104103AF|nr:PqqD family protein [Candidatus Protofrankia californiensis]